MVSELITELNPALYTLQDFFRKFGLGLSVGESFLLVCAFGFLLVGSLIYWSAKK